MGVQELPRKATIFLEEPPAIEAKGDVFHATYSSGDATFSIAFTPHTLLAGIAAAQAAYDEWEAIKSGRFIRVFRAKGN